MDLDMPTLLSIPYLKQWTGLPKIEIKSYTTGCVPGPL